MKEIKINKLLAFLVVTMGLMSCLKEATTNVDVNNPTASIVTLQFIENGSGSTTNSGLQYFSGGALSYPASHVSDTATYNVNLAGATTLGSDLNVTVGVDATKILDNYASDSIKYELMPDSLFHFMSTAATIKAGERIAQLQIVFYPKKVDPSKSYMLPVVVKDAGGKIISSNMGVIYFHVIGNPLAGTYVMTGMRYNFSGSIAWAGPPAIPAGNVGTTAYSSNIVAAPVNAKTITLVMGNVPDPVSGLALYYISGNASFSAITYTFASTFNAGYSNIIKYVVDYKAPSATQKASFHLMTKYNNTVGNGGNDRLIDQTFTHQ
jgi:hypothetical protein